MEPPRYFNTKGKPMSVSGREWTPELFSEILEDVNKVRLALAIGEGKLEALPPGQIQASDQCVLARALSNGWTADVAPLSVLLIPPRDKPEIDVLVCAAELRNLGFDARGEDDVEGRWIYLECKNLWSDFVQDFDAGLFPHLILNDD